MARRYKSKTRRRRRRRKGTRSGNRLPRYAPRALLSGFPKSQLVKLRYVSEISLNSGITYASHTYRANGCFDPDQSGIGHQPMLFDQWSQIYNRYTVFGAKITVRYTPDSTTNAIPPYVGVILSNETDPLSTFTSTHNILESKLIGKNWIVPGATRQLQNPFQNKVAHNFSTRKWFGVKDPNDGASLSAITTADPAKLAYFNVWAASNHGNDPGSIPLLVTIDYIVLFRDPETIDGS